MKHFIFLTLCSALALQTGMAFAAPSPEGVQVTKPIYAWKTETDRDKKTGQFNHCLIKNMYDNGTILMLAENHDGVERLALSFPQSKMKPGQHFDLTVQIDKRDLFPVEAVSVTSQVLTIGIPETLPDQMRKGQALYLRGPNDEVVYTLEGIEGAIGALRDCIMTQQHGQPATSDIVVADARPAATLPLNAELDAKQKKPKAEIETTQAPAPMPAPVTASPVNSAPQVTLKEAPLDKGMEPLPEPPPVKTTDAKPLAAPFPVQAMAPASASAQPVPQASSELEKPGIFTRLGLLKDKIPGFKKQKVIEVMEGGDVAGMEAAPLEVAAAPVVTLPVPAPMPETSELPAVKTKAAENIDPAFAQAGFTPVDMLSSTDLKMDNILDYAWRHNDLLIGAKELPMAKNENFGQTVMAYMTGLKSRCDGNFISESSGQELLGRTRTQVTETACSANNDQDTIGALLFSGSPEKMKVYFFEAPADKGADAIKARDALAEIVKQK